MILLLNLMTLHQVIEHGKRHIGIDGTGSIAQQQGSMHHLANLAALHNKRSLHTLTHSNQVVVHSTDCQQRGNGCVLRIDLSSTQNDIVYPLIHTIGRFLAKRIKGATQATLSLLYLKENRQFDGLKTFIAYVAEYV